MKLHHASAAVCLLAVGCTVDPDPGQRSVVEEPYTRPATVVQTVQIIEGAPLVSVPGEGAGVFVEYRGGGDWAVNTACDTKVSGLTCTWDLFFDAQAGSIDSATAPAGQVGGGGKITLSSGRAELHAINTTATDGILFHVSSPAATVRMEAWLDGKADPRVFYWTGPDAIHEGAPSDPVDFAPIVASK